jgi:hypothetical protein
VAQIGTAFVFSIFSNYALEMRVYMKLVMAMELE